MTKTAIVIRHGAYKDGGSLSEDGKAQVDAALAWVAENSARPCKILCSEEPRTKETAERAQGFFNSASAKDSSVAVETRDALLNNHFNDEPAKILAGLDDREDVVMLVTHEENIKVLSGKFGKRMKFAEKVGFAEVEIFQSPAKTWPDFAKGAHFVQKH